MEFFIISALAAAVFNTGLAILVVRRDLRSLLHRAYIALGGLADDLERRRAGAGAADDARGRVLLGKGAATGGDLHPDHDAATSACN